MKKILLAFMIVDLIFVGLVLTISKQKSRTVASDEVTDPAEISTFTEGQKNKWHLVKTFQFQKSAESLEFTTDKLQMICETSSLIELHYFAQNVAIAGVSPTISHIFSCDPIRKNSSQTSLQTSLSDFKKMHQQKVLTLDGSELRASQVYADEEFPQKWKLAEIKISGANNFTVNQFEIEKTLSKFFDFEVTSAK
ncbi:MAG: hypothetical protein WA160_02550 [Pseudobdellovibrio sp.]